jgi:hypothetical protein
VFLSDGHQLGAPQLWSAVASWDPYGVRYVIADVDHDRMADLVEMRAEYGAGRGMSYVAHLSNGSSGFSHWASLFMPSSGGWSFAGSRQLVGDVTGDGVTDLVTIHAQPNGGILVWLHQGCLWSWPAPACLQPPVVWQDLRTGGWSFAGSRQYLADTNGDGIDDLVSVHQQAFNAGELIWRHVSTGTGLLAPQVIADLRTGGWRYLVSREGVADTWGLRG